MTNSDPGEMRLLLPRNLIDALAAEGLDVAGLSRGAGIEPERLELELGLAELDRFLCLAWEAVNDTAIGLRAGITLRPERFGAVGLASMTCPDLGTALGRIARYNRLVGGGAHGIEQSGDVSVLRLLKTPVPRPYSRAKIDMELAGLSKFARYFTGDMVSPAWATLIGPAPPHAVLYPDVLGCPVTFQAEDDAIAFRTADLSTRLVSANPVLTNALEQILAQRLERLGDDSNAARVRDVLKPMLNGEEPTLTAAARKLGMSTRTLQRRLSDEGVRFSQLLDDVRKVAATALLHSTKTSVLEVSYLLGFSEASSFFRAFKRWTGTTPDAFRVAQLSQR